MKEEYINKATKLMMGLYTPEQIEKAENIIDQMILLPCHKCELDHFLEIIKDESLLEKYEIVDITTVFKKRWAQSTMIDYIDSCFTDEICKEFKIPLHLDRREKWRYIGYLMKEWWLMEEEVENNFTRIFGNGPERDHLLMLANGAFLKK